MLSDDFIPEDSIVNESIVELPESEANLLYVSITRAEKELYLPGMIHYSLYGNGGINPNSDLDELSAKLDEVAEKHADTELHPDVLNAILNK